MTPVVTIGMPVFNEERFVKAALESLLAQDFVDFELLISDNASTDATREIAESVARRDPRVRYSRFQENQRAVENFRRPLAEARGRYFMWAAGHDLWDPAFLRKTVAALDSRADTVLCYPRTRWIDAEGRTLRETSDGLSTEGLGTVARFNAVMWRVVKCTPIYGLIRTDALRRARLRHAFASDLILLTELACFGAFTELPEALFCRRVNRAPESTAEQVERIYQYVGRRPDRRVRLPYLEMMSAHLSMVLTAPVGLGTRATLLTSSLLCLPARYHRRVLQEVREALPEPVRQILPAVDP